MPAVYRAKRKDDNPTADCVGLHAVFRIAGTPPGQYGGLTYLGAGLRVEPAVFLLAFNKPCRSQSSSFRIPRATTICVQPVRPTASIRPTQAQDRLDGVLPREGPRLDDSARPHQRAHTALLITFDKAGTRSRTS